MKKLVAAILALVMMLSFAAMADTLKGDDFTMNLPAGATADMKDKNSVSQGDAFLNVEFSDGVFGLMGMWVDIKPSMLGGSKAAFDALGSGFAEGIVQGFEQGGATVNNMTDSPVQYDTNNGVDTAYYTTDVSMNFMGMDLVVRIGVLCATSDSIGTYVFAGYAMDGASYDSTIAPILTTVAWN